QVHHFCDDAWIFGALCVVEIRGSPEMTALARSTKTLVVSQVNNALEAARSSGSPQTLAATRCVVVLPTVERPHQSMAKFGTPKISSRGGTKEAYSPSSTRLYGSTRRTTSIQPSYVPFGWNPSPICSSPDPRPRKITCPQLAPLSKSSLSS